MWTFQSKQTTAVPHFTHTTSFTTRFSFSQYLQHNCNYSATNILQALNSFFKLQVTRYLTYLSTFNNRSILNPLSTRHQEYLKSCLHVIQLAIYSSESLAVAHTYEYSTSQDQQYVYRQSIIYISSR